ncbi:protein of unknown function (plasmid) [Cupriavidus taiwanensis]|uniref:Uncharacterized protein n=1 Tax=Cupriavidus taiwanensis TaxID=164546 RepID=A0A7Z7JER7_9BURK|nr:protein of unknown function [Cupriavidus taiwanensis]SOZ11650.1 protein of unknown function [Cupriavidus taiwanensis]SOZ43005.1 protein of unknown function [Cupriavidus taiwanensis]SPC22252.1 protein of unknown function [Cupriavidus taiwanensis]SPD53754.1 protein of unknown function [Cupriavidus taiwanensis]
MRRSRRARGLPRHGPPMEEACENTADVRIPPEGGRLKISLRLLNPVATTQRRTQYEEAQQVRVWANS